MIDRHKYFRVWDVVSMAALLALIGTIYTLVKHPMQWDQNTSRLDRLEPRVESIERKEETFEDKNQAQMTLIIRELDQIHKAVK